MLVIAWEYLVGRAVATDPTDRSLPEWPPHPDRVFQALVAAWGEAGCSPAQAEAIHWLAGLGAPQITFPSDATPGAVVRTYVPVNDVEGPARGEYKKEHQGLIPERRPRKPRYFPAVHVGSGVCSLTWPNADFSARAAVLASLCASVTRLGHSTSLVRMWSSEDPATSDAPTLVPVSTRPECRLRVPTAGRLQELVGAFSGGGAGWRRPPVAMWQGYAAPRRVPQAQGQFDERLIVLRQSTGQRMLLQQAPLVLQALRGLLMSRANNAPMALKLISGHEEDGRPLDAVHVSLMPLAFVGDPGTAGGHRHADGHLLGLALALPRDLDPDAEQQVFDALASALQQGTATLTLGQWGTMELRLEDRPQPPAALRSTTWTGPGCSWGTVTPIVLDRMTPRRHLDPDAWAADQIAMACTRQGLPAPADIELLPVSPLLGSPSAAAFPALLRKDGTRRWHVHARLHFRFAIQGPLLLGAGRYQGYGVCKPLWSQAAS